MAWTSQERQIVQDLGNRLNALELKVKNLEDCCNKVSCDCSCKIFPHYVSINTNYIYTDTNSEGQEFENYRTAEELGIPHDRFPEPACVGEKGIISMIDVWLLCQYHEQDGWVIFDFNRK
jgi:hypothetical protein